MDPRLHEIVVDPSEKVGRQCAEEEKLENIDCQTNLGGLGTQNGFIVEQKCGKLEVFQLGCIEQEYHIVRIPTTRKVRQKNKGKIVKDFQPAIFAMIFSALNDILTYQSHLKHH